MRILFIIFLLFSTFCTLAQNNDNSIGAGLGIGSFTGDFPAQTVFGAKLFYETRSPVSIFNKLQFHTTLAQKIEKFLPDSFNSNHYSYFINLGLSGIFEQPLNQAITIREGIGLIYLNDRSFDDINTWNIGTLLSLGFLTNLNREFIITLNIDYGITFNNTNSRYFLLLVGISHGI